MTEILTNLKVFQDGLEWNEVNYLKHIYHLFQQKPSWFRNIRPNFKWTAFNNYQ
ncbi:hypothetical protein [Spiroplasma sp. Moj]|uniref:hypothetical protein n=1 Tax=Spiroplasma sp. Moj TaxID=1922342 RepID=UPI0039EF50EE